MFSKIHKFLLEWKPIHLCWLFEKLGLPVPKYFIGGPAVPNIEQVHWKIGDNDNADPDGCTFDALDTTRTGQAKSSPFMVRLQITNDGDPALNSIFQLYYNDSDTTTGAVQVGAALDGNVKVDSVLGEPTDQAVTDVSSTVFDNTGSFTWQNGRYDEIDAATEKLLLAENYYTDFQFCVQFTADAANETTYYFFMYEGGVPIQGYNSSAKVTTAVGGTDYEETPTDTQGITDAGVAIKVGNVLSDDVGITDSFSKASEFKRSLADTQDITDAGVEISVGNKLTDTQDITDAGIAVSVGNKLADTQGITDAGVAIKVGNKLADSVGITDSFAKVSEFKRSLTDTVDIADSPSMAIGLNLADSFDISDSVEAGLSFKISLTDTVTITDTGLVNDIGLGLADALALTDSFSKVSEFYKDLTDTLEITDGLVNAVGLGLSDTLDLADSFAKTSEFYRSLTDTQNISDGLVNAVGLGLADTLNLTDSFVKVSEFKRSLTDTLSMSDLYEDVSVSGTSYMTEGNPYATHSPSYAGTDFDISKAKGVISESKATGTISESKANV